MFHLHDIPSRSIIPIEKTPRIGDNYGCCVPCKKVGINPTGDKDKYETYTIVDDGKVGEAKAILDIMGADPSTIYIHICAGYHAFTKPTPVDNVAISADSIEGNIDVEPPEKLCLTWGKLKAR